jgi:transcriptional regulator with XRE-family HTH domain
MSIVGQRLRFWRRRARLSQGAVAQRLGVSEALVAMWEVGRRRFPAKEYIGPLAALLGVEPDAIVGDVRAGSEAPVGADRNR